MIRSNFSFLENELGEVLRLFYEEEPDLVHEGSDRGGEWQDVFRLEGETFCRTHALGLPGDELIRKRLIKRFAKLSLYEALSEKFGRSLPYGAITGVRPAKLFRMLAAEGEQPERYLREVLRVSPEKTALLAEINRVQAPFLAAGEKAADLYVGVPFCNGRCSYCSFVSCDINRTRKLVRPYAEALCREIGAAADLIREAGLSLRAIYVGGGTPSSLPAEEIREILEALRGLSAPEFTFEAGRPDSITPELLALLKDFGVNRMSVNPQTVHDRTLEIIGRRHTFADYERAMETVQKEGFLVNTDLIMGLPGETPDDFEVSVRRVAAFRPENVTVHALSVKQGSVLKTETRRIHAEGVDRMSAFALDFLRGEGYRPYYTYRQKYTAGNLENAGYALPGTECVYNIDNMEETASVVACGANAISKRVFEGGSRIERSADPKDVYTYLNKLDDRILAKRRLFGL